MIKEYALGSRPAVQHSPLVGADAVVPVPVGVPAGVLASLFSSCLLEIVNEGFERFSNVYLRIKVDSQQSIEPLGLANKGGNQISRHEKVRVPCRSRIPGNQLNPWSCKQRWESDIETREGSSPVQVSYSRLLHPPVARMTKTSLQW
jgi:hypothetical protein